MIRVLMRADAYPAIGTGDLMSLVHFSRHPRITGAGWECHFMVQDHATARKLLAGRRIERVVFVDPGATVDQETDAIARYVKANDIDAVLFEITGRRLDDFDLTTVDAAKGAVDFYNWIPEGLDIVVNWDTAARGRYHRARHPGTVFCLGPEYVFLAPEFLCGAGRWHPESPDTRPVVIAMGGADEFDLTGRILAGLLERTDPRIPLTAVVGAGYGSGDALTELAAGAGGRLTIKRDVTDMAGEFVGARHVFGAGGLTAYELVATGTPCSLVACYDHQVHRCRTFAEKGWARYLGHRSALAPIDLPASAPQDVAPTLPPPFVSGIEQVAAALEEAVRRRRGMGAAFTTTRTERVS